MIVTSIFFFYLHSLTPSESPRNHGAGMFSLDMTGVHVDRCTRDKETETQIGGRSKRERQTARDLGRRDR